MTQQEMSEARERELRRRARIAYAEGHEELTALKAFYMAIPQQLVPPSECEAFQKLKDEIAKAKQTASNLCDRLIAQGLIKPKPKPPTFGHTDTGTIGYSREE
jgi:hypothetical protein